MAHKKMGRPHATHPLDFEVKARLDKETFESLVSYCKANNVERAATIRKIIKEFLEIEHKK